MIDFHAHILPDIDDGSQGVPMSEEMLLRSSEAGVTTLIATPHFYADRQYPEEFLEDRRLAYERLLPCLRPELPRILPGAEVHFFEGISGAACIPELCIENTDLLLLEMPMCRWAQCAIDELCRLALEQPVTVMLAHMERYIDYQPRDIIDGLRRRGILIQCNASFFIQRRTRRKALKLLQRGTIDVLGSDCHNVTSRLPNIGQAMSQIEAHLGEREASAFVCRGQELLAAHDLGGFQI